jgi:colanic acid biosynthesis glycosyl transferase WcaI
MRILIVGINFYPEMTGIGKYTGEMATYLSQAGHQTRVVTAPPYYPYWQVQPGYKWWGYRRENWNGVQVFRCPLWVPSQPTGFKRLLHLSTFALSSLPVLLGQVLWQPEIVLCIAPALMNAPFALIIARLCGAKAWLHIQDFELDAAANLGMLPADHSFTKFAAQVEHWLLNSFEYVSSISNRMLARLAQKGVAPEKTVLFPNWVDTEVIFPSSAAGEMMRKDLSITSDKIIVLYSGNMGYKQGLEVVVETAGLLRSYTNIYFMFCGDGAIRHSLEIATKDLPNVRFLPLQPLERLNALLNMADIHILPQRADAADLVMPSKLSGMLASGKPVIATAKPETGVSEIVKQLGVVVPPQDVSTLANTIIRLAEDPDLRYCMGQKGLNWVMANWSKEKVLQDFCEQIENTGKLSLEIQKKRRV